MSWPSIISRRLTSKQQRIHVIAGLLSLLPPSILSAAGLPLLYDGCTLRVPASVYDKSALLIFDTGSSVSALDKNTYNPQLGKPIAEARVSSITGLTKLEFYRSPEILLGKLTEHFGRIAAMDLHRIKAISGSECDGVLGADFAREHVISIDFDQRLFDVDDVHESNEVSAEAVSLPLKTLGNGNFGIDAVLDGVTVTFMIDTGDNGSISLNPEDWRRLLAAHPGTVVHTILAASVSGPPVQTSGTRVSDLTVGPNHYSGFIATAIHNPLSPSTLGLRFLRQHVVSFDIPHGTLLLRRGYTFGEREKFDMSGIHLIRTDETTTVFAVDEGSPASEANIKPGDVVDEVDGISAAALTMREIRRALKRQDGSLVRLKVRRGSQNSERTLHLRTML